MTKFRFNGRTRYFVHLFGFQKIGEFTYTVRRNDIEYTIFGGRKAGGRRNEWFVTSKEWDKPIYTSSLVGSLNLLEGM